MFVFVTSRGGRKGKKQLNGALPSKKNTHTQVD